MTKLAFASEKVFAFVKTVAAFAAHRTADYRHDMQMVAFRDRIIQKQSPKNTLFCRAQKTACNLG